MSLRSDLLAASASEREAIILHAVQTGNVPQWVKDLSQWQRVTITDGKNTLEVKFMRNVLAIGETPFYLPTAPSNLQAIADKLGACLLTRKLADIRFANVKRQIPFQIPKGFTIPGPDMESAKAILSNSDQINALCSDDSLSYDGHSKSVLCGPLAIGNKLAIYGGWAKGILPPTSWVHGWAIQGFTLSAKYETDKTGKQILVNVSPHNADYIDYSQKAPLIALDVRLNGSPTTLRAVCKDPATASLVSDQGAFDPYWPNASSGSGGGFMPVSTVPGKTTPPSGSGGGSVRPVQPRSDETDNSHFFIATGFGIASAIAGYFLNKRNGKA